MSTVIKFLASKLAPTYLCMFLLPLFLMVHCTAGDCLAEGAHRHTKREALTESKDARPQIIKIGPAGLSSSNFTMQQSDSVVFFYNTTDQELLTLEIDFGKRSVHCSGALRVVKEPGLSRSRKPFGPKEFISTCFHERGAYPFKVFTSTKNYSGTVTVE